MVKRPIRKARRKARRAKVKSAVSHQLMEELGALRTRLAIFGQRIERIEKFLEPDLSEFHEKEKIAADPLAAAGAG